MASQIKYDDVNVGDDIPTLVVGPVARHDLALYAGASGDHNPIHTDIDAAKKSGLGDVIIHGMLQMAYLGRLLTDWAPQDQLREFTSRFTAMARPHDTITCTGKITEKFEEDGEKRVRLELAAATDKGDTTLQGTAVVALS
jgi:acyl dehydratase